MNDASRMVNLLSFKICLSIHQEGVNYLHIMFATKNENMIAKKGEARYLILM